MLMEMAALIHICHSYYNQGLAHKLLRFHIPKAMHPENVTLSISDHNFFSYLNNTRDQDRQMVKTA